MDKKNKGISLVSLIVIIVSTIILIGVAFTTGYNYIEESKRTEATAVVKLISSEASNLQNSMHTDAISGNVHYIGHALNTDDIDNIKNNIKGLPTDFNINATEELWYIIDGNAGEELGVKDSSKYLEKDILNTKEDTVKVALVDYITGEAYLVEIKTEYLGELKEDSACPASPDGTHGYSIQTCTKGSFCVYCGKTNEGHETGLGHDISYDTPTCTAAGICVKCNEINPNAPALGHDFKLNAIGAEEWQTDATRHWKECQRENCNAKKDMEEHLKGYIKITNADGTYDAKYHKEVCSTCGWESIETVHKMSYEMIGSTVHKRYCELCEYSDEHIDSGWKFDDTHHWKECTEDDCPDRNKKLFHDEHEDNNSDNLCDTCGKILDDDGPNAFDASNAKVISTTTSKIQVSAHTTDTAGGVGIKGYYFGIDYKDGDGIEWTNLIETGDLVANHTFINLEHKTEYDIYVKAIDYGENETPVYKILDTRTQEVPTIKGIKGVPTEYVKGAITIEFNELQTTLPDLSIEYSLDGGATWNNVVNSVTITDEDVELSARVKDTRSPEPNKGEIWKTTISIIDNTPPVVSNITAKDGDDSTELSVSHTAVVEIQDQKVGIAPNTTIKYGWSLSDSTEPTTYYTITTTNTDTIKNTTIEVTTPAESKGEYYLWIDSGVSDALGNETEEPVCSKIKFNVDDEDVTISNIRMYNANPEIDGKRLFVKTGGTVTVTFAASKALGKAPKVIVGGVASTNVTSSDMKNWTATIKAASAMPEGKLSLTISNIETESGKDSSNTYTEANLIEGPVTYDATLPVFENVNK